MLCLQNLAGYCVHVIFVLYAVRGEFQFKNGSSVVVVEFLVVEYSVSCADICLGQSDFLCLLQSDIGRELFCCGVGRIVVVIVNGYDIGGQV